MYRYRFEKNCSGHQKPTAAKQWLPPFSAHHYPTNGSEVESGTPRGDITCPVYREGYCQGLKQAVFSTELYCTEKSG